MFAGFAIRIALASLFAASALAKALNMPAFSDTVGFFITNRSYAVVAAWIVCLVEAAIALALLFDGSFLAASVATLAMAILFAGVSLDVLKRHIHVSCMCFGKNGGQIGVSTLMRAIVLALAASALVLMTMRGEDVSGPQDLISWMSLTTTIVGALILARWILLAPEIRAAFVSRRKAYIDAK